MTTREACHWLDIEINTRGKQVTLAWQGTNGLTKLVLTKAYRAAAMKHHPDKNLGNESEATIKTQKVNEAREVLKFSLATNVPWHILISDEDDERKRRQRAERTKRDGRAEAQQRRSEGENPGSGGTAEAESSHHPTPSHSIPGWLWLIIIGLLLVCYFVFHFAGLMVLAFVALVMIRQFPIKEEPPLPGRSRQDNPRGHAHRDQDGGAAAGAGSDGFYEEPELSDSDSDDSGSEDENFTGRRANERRRTPMDDDFLHWETWRDCHGYNAKSDSGRRCICELCLYERERVLRRKWAAQEEERHRRAEMRRRQEEAERWQRKADEEARMRQKEEEAAKKEAKRLEKEAKQRERTAEYEKQQAQYFRNQKLEHERKRKEEEDEKAQQLRRKEEPTGGISLDDPARICANCNAREFSDDREFKNCSRCKLMSYCSTACQKQHWTQGRHKQVCRPPEQQAEKSIEAAKEAVRMNPTHVSPPAKEQKERDNSDAKTGMSQTNKAPQKKEPKRAQKDLAMKLQLTQEEEKAQRARKRQQQEEKRAATVSSETPSSATESAAEVACRHAREAATVGVATQWPSGVMKETKVEAKRRQAEQQCKEAEEKQRRKEERLEKQQEKQKKKGTVLFATTGSGAGTGSMPGPITPPTTPPGMPTLPSPTSDVKKCDPAVKYRDHPPRQLSPKQHREQKQEKKSEKETDRSSRASRSKKEEGSPNTTTPNVPNVYQPPHRQEKTQQKKRFPKKKPTPARSSAQEVYQPPQRRRNKAQKTSNSEQERDYAAVKENDRGAAAAFQVPDYLVDRGMTLEGLLRALDLTEHLHRLIDERVDLEQLDYFFSLQEFEGLREMDLPEEAIKKLQVDFEMRTVLDSLDLTPQHWIVTVDEFRSQNMDVDLLKYCDGSEFTDELPDEVIRKLCDWIKTSSRA